MSNRIYIGRISSRTSERDIEKFFKGFGRIRFMSLKNGYGFVDLEDERDADDAVYELHGKELLGERVIVEHAKGPARRSSFGRSAPPPQRFPRGPRPTWLDKYGAPVRTGYKLIVENLSSRVSWQDLKDYMRQAGDVTFADAHKGEKNVGVVEFASYADMKKAKEKLDGTEINGRKIKLIEDVNNAPRLAKSLCIVMIMIITLVQ
ncbi:hypothetical protein HELRODRAFT_62194 [Helobdella robusta]|uniref:RRM domain-containing protein n=1 Tax=Helobdella robusta TaxID=6412 RepID=T1FWW8_HELRO|nr:hypothetical protein HELRODRAFT_62194 [Helobdella robusta]ESO12196.1 hypothetical protein HELRODRAFT_62194 [Helobdella robusta]